MLIACENKQGHTISPAEYYDISEQNIGAYEKKANNGDGLAAWSLAHYYTHTKHNSETSLYWSKISAENGYGPGMYNYAVMLSIFADSKEDLLKARYWLQEAKKRGEPNAAFEIKQIDRRLKNK